MLKPSFCQPSYPRASMLSVVGVMGGLIGALTPAHAVRRPGAPRPLRINWPQEQQPGALLLAGAQTGANFDGVLVGHDGVAPPDTVFFTREADGTRNIWRAVAQAPAGTEANAGITDRAARWPTLTWTAAPLTRFAAPLFAAQATVTPDGRTLLCATNAMGGGGVATAHSQIARLDLTSGRWTTLTPTDADDHAPTVSPDGREFAFVSSRSGLESIYVMPVAGGPARRIITLGRNPCWLDNSTLLFESVRPGQTGLYRLTLPPDGAAGVGEARPRLFFDRTGEATSAPDDQALCVAAMPDPRARRRLAPNPAAVLQPQLYLLAPDGAGAREIPGTEGARNPRFAPDGSGILYDAPVDNGNGALNAASRTLWLMPMLRVPPTARLLDVKPVIEPGAVTPPVNVPVSDPGRGVVVNTVEVLGTAFAESSAPLVKLEYGEGSAPTRWQELPTARGTVQEGKLATWKLPPGATGIWTLRLTVTDASHDEAQTMLPITLPIYTPLPEKPPSITAPAHPTPLIAGPPSTRTPHPGSAMPGRVTHSAVAAINPARVGTRAAHSKPLRLAGTVKNLPLPALPPAPTPVPKGNAGATPTPNGNSPNSLPTFPQDKPGPAAPPYIPPDAPDARPTPKPPRKRRPPRHIRTPRQSTTTPRTARSGNTPDAPVTNPPVGDNSGDAARVSVVGTPAIMETGQSVNVTATLFNTGTRAWATESGQPVRLVYRWTDATTGIRTRWAVRWLRATVAPGSSAQLAITLDAPPRPGRYRLSYVLVRLNGDKFEPPPATTPTARWPGEFGGITYGVIVRPGARPTPLPPER